MTLKSKKMSRCIVLLALCFSLSACVSTVVGAAVDTVIEVAKIPFKVGGAVIDVMTPDKHNDSSDEKKSNQESDEDQ